MKGQLYIGKDAICRSVKYLVKFTAVATLMLAHTPSLAQNKPAYTYNYTLTGIKQAAALQNVKDRLNILQKQFKQINPISAKALFHDSAKAIKIAMEPYGYFQASVKKSLQQKGTQWQASFTVTPGEPIRIMKLDVHLIGEGKTNKALQQAFNKFLIKKGQVLNVDTYKKAKIHLLNIAHRQGFIHAAYRIDKVTVNLITYQATLALTFDTHKRYYIGPIKFVNKTPLDEAFLRRFLTLKPGEPYSLNKLLKLQSNYSGTGYFHSVNIIPKSPKKNEPANQIPLNIRLGMNKKYLYQIGGGFGTLSGPRVAFGMNARWLTPWGNKFKLSSQWSRTFHQLEAQYLIPAHDPLSAYYTINGALYIIMPPRDAKAFVKKIGPGYLWKKGLWTFDSRLNLMQERWRLSGDDHYHDSTLLQPYINISRLSVANPILVENGNRITFIVSGAYTGLLSSVSYIQPQFQFKGIKTLGKDNRIIFATQDGMTFVHDNSKMPLSERFYAGGQNSLLGFKYQSLGPGKYVTAANLEYQRRLSGMFYAGMFYNVGNAFNQYKSFANYRQNLGRSNGLDFVWRSPLGDITIYWARAVSKAGSPNSIGFTLGPEL